MDPASIPLVTSPLPGVTKLRASRAMAYLMWRRGHTRPPTLAPSPQAIAFRYVGESQCAVSDENDSLQLIMVYTRSYVPTMRETGEGVQ